VTPQTILYMGLFVAGQVVSNVASKWGTLDDRYWWWAWIGGNLISVASVLAQMKALQLLATQPNLVHIVCNAFIFTGIQLAYWLIFKGELRPIQWLAMGIMLMSMVVFTLAAPSSGGAPRTGPPAQAEPE